MANIKYYLEKQQGYFPQYFWPLEYRDTHDLPDGQVCPPYIENGIPWRVVQRFNNHTLWFRPLLKSSSGPARRPALEDKQARRQGD